MTNPNEQVDHPSHYKSNGMEAIDVIEAFDLNFRLGNAVKYILRAGRKNDRTEDLEKAAWYVRREIEKLREVPPQRKPDDPAWVRRRNEILVSPAS